MTKRRYTPEFFDDRIEAGQIEMALLEAIPEDCHYSALIIALSNIFAKVVTGWVNENCNERWHGKQEPTA